MSLTRPDTDVAVSTAAGDKIMKDVRPGVPFEPTYIYRLLTLIKSSLSEKVCSRDPSVPCFSPKDRTRDILSISHIGV